MDCQFSENDQYFFGNTVKPANTLLLALYSINPSTNLKRIRHIRCFTLQLFYRLSRRSSTVLRRFENHLQLARSSAHFNYLRIFPEHLGMGFKPRSFHAQQSALRSFARRDGGFFQKERKKRRCKCRIQTRNFLFRPGAYKSTHFRSFRFAHRAAGSFQNKTFISRVKNCNNYSRNSTFDLFLFAAQRLFFKRQVDLGRFNFYRRNFDPCSQS